MTFDLADAQSILARTPASLHALLHGLPPGWIHGNAGPATWSPYEVVAHLAYCETTVWPGRIRRIMEEGERRPFEAVDRTGHTDAFRDWPIDDVLEAFAARRADTLAFIDTLGLTPADGDRTGIHPSLGVVTLRQLLSIYVLHDLTHTKQIVRTMAAQYATEIGPWGEREHYAHPR